MPLEVSLLDAGLASVLMGSEQTLLFKRKQGTCMDSVPILLPFPRCEQHPPSLPRQVPWLGWSTASEHPVLHLKWEL